MSWRDDTPEPIQDDLDLLIDRALTAARELLGPQRGEMYPFALGLRPGGPVDLISGLADDPSPAVVLELLYESVPAQRGAFAAVAFVAAVTGEAGDAVRVEVEHRDGGPALAIYLPFRHRRLRGMEYGELGAELADRRVWP